MAAPAAAKRQRASMPARTNSLQKMLELEKKYKLERLQENTLSTAFQSPRHVVNELHPQHIPPLQVRRRDSLPHHSNSLMWKSVHRSTAAPSLSISVPPPANHAIKVEGPPEVKEAQGGKTREKSVAFLAVEDDKSDAESSICQSPSWEGYGQKKKDKKLELKQKRKEREQAEQEARAARRKTASRLTKTPPITRTPITAQRSISAPILPVQERPRRASTQLLEHYDAEKRPIHTRQHSEGATTQLDAVMTGPKPVDTGFIGGLKLERERAAVMQRRLDAGLIPFPQPPTSDDNPRPQPQTTRSAGSSVRVSAPVMSRTNLAEPVATVVRPPSHKRPHLMSPRAASRTQSMISPTAPAIPDLSKVYQWRERTSSTGPPQLTQPTQPTQPTEDTAAEVERGRSTVGYVRQQRQNSTDRAMSGLVDETRVSAKSHYPPLSSRPYQTRAYSVSSTTSSSGQGTSTVADGPSPKENDGLPDYLKAMDQPYTPPSLDLHTPRASDAEPMRSRSRLRDKSTSSGAVKSFKDAAKAALNRIGSSSHGAKTPIGSYFDRRARDTSVGPDSASTSQASQISSTDRLGRAPKAARVLGEFNNMTMKTQQSNKLSDRSSVSSYEESLPSPSLSTTTPNSSRPHSEKGSHKIQDEVESKVPETLLAANDDGGSFKSEQAILTNSSTPATCLSPSSVSQPESKWKLNDDPQEFQKLEDLWSSDSPLLDMDDQSFKSCLSPDAPEGSDASLLPSPLQAATLSPKTEANSPTPTRTSHDAEVRKNQNEPTTAAQPVPSLSKSRSTPDLLLDTSFLPKLKHQPLVPPPRSKARRESITLPPPSRETSKSLILSPPMQPPSGPANYLQEARKSAPPPKAPRNLRSSPLIGKGGPAPLRVPGMAPDGRVDPIAKMFVECCSCKFFHDMPSRVYECMANPDTVVEDRDLGVSGAITTMVKCPWCAHGMTMKCCAGYAAVVYLKEKLH